MIREKLLPIILCGGKGERLWPLSRESFPKQFIALGNDREQTLLQKTYTRISDLENLEKPIFICNEEHRFITAEQLREKNINPQSIILEPFGRGTASAIAIAALSIMNTGQDPLLLILSSDHEISNQDKFIKSIKVGIESAVNGRLVTFGVVPNSPETGYGYIESEVPLNNEKIKASKILRFIEKPNFDKAKILFQDRRFSWNSGIFLFRASIIVDQITKYYPEIVSQCKKALDNSQKDLDFFRIHKDHFYNCPNISIDKAVMEKTSIGTVVPLISEWSDLGSWKQVWENSEKDNNGNSFEGKIISKDSYDSYIKSDNRLVVALGIKNLIIVDSSDALLILNKEYSQEIKSVVQKLKRNNILEGREHKKIYRPWGNYTSLIEEKNWKVKKIVVYPNQSLSLQLHKHRSENWVVIKGSAKVEIDNEIMLLEANQSAYIPLGSKHRLSNPGKDHLILIEVQSGSYLEEDDIVRFEDNYGRII